MNIEIRLENVKSEFDLEVALTEIKLYLEDPRVKTRLLTWDAQSNMGIRIDMNGLAVQKEEI